MDLFRTSRLYLQSVSLDIGENPILFKRGAHFGISSRQAWQHVLTALPGVVQNAA
jgi:hypothetical protein